MTAPRVGIVGARRRRQGLGPFVARELRAAGADVTCFVTTSESSRDEAGRALETLAGVTARGYTDLATLLSHERVDALAILSPSDTHAAALDAALPALLKEDLTDLVELTADHGAREASPLVQRWMRERLVKRMKR